MSDGSLIARLAELYGFARFPLFRAGEPAPRGNHEIPLDEPHGTFVVSADAEELAPEQTAS